MSVASSAVAIGAANKEDIMDRLLMQILASVGFSVLGMLVLGIAYVLIEKLAPFSVRKELTEDDNPAVGILLGAVMIGLSIIIAAAIV